MEWSIYLAAGAVAGLLAGLFGVGGGLIVVPVLASVFAWLMVAPDHLMQLALGTSLATIVATSASSTLAHHRHGGVNWALVGALAPGIIAGTWLGAGIADLARSEHLRWAFGVAEILLGVYLWRKGSASTVTKGQVPGAVGLTAAGGVIGTVSSLAGIGGGTLTVPFLVRSGLVMANAVGTSAACGLPIAIAGSAAYAVAGWNAPGLPAQALGYVYWPAALGIMVASVCTAPLGARLAHRLPSSLLKRGFAGLLVLLGFKMLLG